MGLFQNVVVDGAGQVERLLQDTSLQKLCLEDANAPPVQLTKPCAIRTQVSTLCIMSLAISDGESGALMAFAMMGTVLL